MNLTKKMSSNFQMAETRSPGFAYEETPDGQFACQVTPCKQARETFKFRQNYIRHFTKVHQKMETRFRCPLSDCESSFAYPDRGYRHMREIHQKEDKKEIYVRFEKFTITNEEYISPKGRMNPKIGNGKRARTGTKRGRVSPVVYQPTKKECPNINPNPDKNTTIRDLGLDCSDDDEYDFLEDPKEVEEFLAETSKV